jgi:hypothetical protein
MTVEENKIECNKSTFNDNPPIKLKREIFRFNGEKPTAINLEYVTHMSIEGNKITFNFFSSAIFIELLDEATAASLFEVLLTSWSEGVVK